MDRPTTIIAARIVRGVPVDPVDPPADYVDPIRRPETEWAIWRDRPYVARDDRGWSVRCLGRSDHSPRIWAYGIASIDDAVDMAREAYLPRAPRSADHGGLDLDF